MKRNETVDEILREMRERADAMQIHGTVLGVKRTVKEFADRIKAAYRREFDEAARALDKLTEGICSHCDMQKDCAEGEDGMSTMCNAMYGVRKFIKEHKMEENSNELPF